MAQGTAKGQIETKEQAAPWKTTNKGSDNQIKYDKENASKKGNDHGAWGPTFKDKNHFASLHHC